MVIYLNDDRGVLYLPHGKTPNLIEVPAGTRITGLHVDGGHEATDFVSEGEPIMVAITAIRRVREQKRAA